MGRNKNNKGVADVTTIDFGHYKVHDGEMYSASYSFGVTSASNLDIMVVTGTGEPHITFEANGSGQALITLMEGITSSANGTSIPVYNFKRESSNSCTAVFFQQPTWSTNTEVVIKTILLPGGAHVQTRVGGNARSGVEWELLASTKYIMRIANQAGTTNTTSFNAEFYEE